MKKKLLLLSLTYTFFIGAATTEKKPLSSEDLVEHGKKWSKQVVQKLDKEELALLANYLYFNFLNARYDNLINTGFILCQNNLINMQYALNSNEENALKNSDAIIKQAAFLQGEAIPARSYANKAAQGCFEHIEDTDLPALKKVIANFQQYSTSVLNQFIQQDWPKAITKLLSTCADNMQKAADKLVACQVDLSTKSALESDTDNDAEFYGQNFQQAIATADLSYTTYLGLISHTLTVKSMSADILNITAIINNIFYNQLLETLKSNKKAGSLPIMFDENGFIEEDDQDETLAPLDEKFTIHKKHLKLIQG